MASGVYRWPAARLAEMRKLYEDGTAYADIAARYGIKPNTVGIMGSKHGWKRPRQVRKVYNKPRVNWTTVKHHYENTAIPISAIAKRAHMSAPAPIRHARQRNWKLRDHAKRNAVKQPGEYAPHVQSAITYLRRKGFAVFKEGHGFRFGTVIITEKELLAKAEKHARAA